MTHKLDVFVSFRSPYSYLAMARLEDLVAQRDLELTLRPVRPLLLRDPEVVVGRPQFLSYLMVDVRREAERLGLVVQIPQPDPVARNDDGLAASEQPHLMRLLHRAMACRAMVGDRAALAFSERISRSIWSGQPGWTTDAFQSEVMKSLGADIQDVDAYVQEHGDAIRAEMNANEDDQLKHHWGVPLMVLNDEPFFGQDRIDALRWRLDQA